MEPVILASASPRRAELLRHAGIAFEVRVSHVPEVHAAGESAESYVRRLARAKAEAIVAPGRIVLGADTTVCADGQILEKPSNAADAARMLRLLSGRWHEVLTGICVVCDEGSVVDSALTRVRFAELTESGIASYIASGEPMDKAGAYGIQGLASKWVEAIEGCYFNVVGLPVSLVWRHLQERVRSGTCV